MNRVKFIAFLILLSFVVPFNSIAQEWRSEASLSVHKPGLIEVPLLPELHQQVDDDLDLKVLGPDGKSRSFELYWHEDKRDTAINLTGKSTKLENNIFIWETLIPVKDRIQVKSIKINVLSSNYIGKVDIFGLREGTWINLVRKSALYSSDGVTRGDIEIDEYLYEGFRLEFMAYAKKPVPIGQVQALGEKPGRDYAETSIGIKYQRTDRKDSADKIITNLTATLPGSGLYIQDIELLTVAQFNGNWSLEREELHKGQKTFIAEMTGTIAGVNKGEAALKIKLDRVWKSKVLKLKLTGSNEALSDINHFAIKVRVPRLVFLADTAGAYLVQTGLNHKVKIMEYPSAQRLDIPVAMQFSMPRINQNLPKENLSKQYELGGAPFKTDGYQWRSDIKLSGPGYYRFILHQKASLEENINSLRIVRNGRQYPYFMETGKKKECELILKESHDQATNTTTWNLELPQVSSRWTALVLQASGIFNRTLKVERDQPKPVQGVLWHSVQWSNASASPSEISISLHGFPREEKRIRLVMEHGDNKPIKIEKAKALYEAPAIHFLADAADGYELFGGNQVAQAPLYDIDLVKDQLSKQEPRIAALSEPKMLQDTAIRNAITNLFAKNNWGLYIVLGLLSFGLIIIIVFVFPKAKDRQ
ncbi:MAG: hypothetical protein JW943_09060 [Deltaproteobacteria bacterium]|nr:hypothetical protein [Deltaproteobacteria bacterium]